tara:strand:- start:1069 stop:1383 length:315 start_codon:yes stop_codon:yes gene_type:complete
LLLSRHPRWACGFDFEYPSVLEIFGMAEMYTDAQKISRKFRHDYFSPFDANNGFVFEKLGEVKIQDFCKVIEAVDIKVVETEATFVAGREGECGTGHSLADSKC